MGIETHAHGRTDCDMIMLFHGGTCETVFWSSWTTTTTGPFIAWAIGIFILGIIHEALRGLREMLFESESRKVTKLTFVRFLASKHHIVQTLLHFVQVTIAYALMLIVMNFNYWQCLATLLGLAAGYFSFGWMQKSTVDSNSCCY